MAASPLAGYAGSRHRGLLAPDDPEGILAGAGRRGGILSGIRDLRNRERGQRPVLDFLGDRSAALTGMGLALLTARTQRQAFEGLQNALNSGRQVDFARGQQRREEASQARKEQALATVLQHYGLDQGLSALPEVAQAAIVDAMKPDEPKDARTLTGPDGIPRWLDGPNAGQEVFPGVTKPAEEFSDLTDPAERAAAGVPADYTGPVQRGPDNKLYYPNTPGVSVNIGNMTEGQSNAHTFATRMENAAPVLDELEMVGTEYDQYGLSRLPLGIGNMAISDEYRRFKRAADDFVRAALRKESGALISVEDQEYANTTWIPMPGDDDQTLADKREARRIVMESIRRGAGPLADNPLTPRDTTIRPDPFGIR